MLQRWTQKPMLLAPAMTDLVLAAAMSAPEGTRDRTLPVGEIRDAVAAALRAAAVPDLTQTISNPPTQAEVQAIQSRLNQLLASLRASGLLAT